jgi:hypothetical protein
MWLGVGAGSGGAVRFTRIWIVGWLHARLAAF